MNNTVFILGAGASKDLDNWFPTGAELASSIQGELSSEMSQYRSSPGNAGPILEAILRDGLGDAEWKALDRIKNGIVTKESIDEFIDEYQDVPRLADIGKLAITHRILSAEDRCIWGESKRSNGDPSQILLRLRDTWLGRILRFQNRAVARRNFAEAMAGVVFITFNYDRVLEKTLWEHLVTALGVPEDEAVELMATIPIVHVYGAIGHLPELGGKQAFGKEGPYLRHSAAQIRTFTQTTDSMLAETIAAMVANAQRLCFLGLGFHPRNMEVLFPNGFDHFQTPGAPQIFATAQGLSGRRFAEISSAFTGPFKPSAIHASTASQLMQDYHDDLFE